MQTTDSIKFPGENWAFAKDIYLHAPVPLPQPGSYRNMVLDGVTRNIVDGAQVSVPSENIAFILGGSRVSFSIIIILISILKILYVQNPTWGEIRTYFPSVQYQAASLSKQFISVDLSEMKTEKWDNATLPAEIPARSAGGLEWVPLGSKGSLIAFGGTTLDYNMTETLDRSSRLYWNSTVDFAKKKTEGTGLLETVHVYDVAGKVWYSQKTSGDTPPPTADFCSSVAVAQDGSSYQVCTSGSECS